jgi:GWxTD domain-containing protein
MMVGPPASLARAVLESLDVSYDSLSLEVKVRLVHYLLNPVEKQTLNSLTAVGKETFLDQYWREHDSDPETEVVENRREMLARYLFCSNFFSNNVEEPDGWSTDRGRIYMTYGPWEERDDIQAPNVGRPFEVWYYHSIREGAVFVFEDKQGFEDYTLVHSNAEGERFSDEWDNKLQDELYKIY